MLAAFELLLKLGNLLLIHIVMELGIILRTQRIDLVCF